MQKLFLSASHSSPLKILVIIKVTFQLITYAKNTQNVLYMVKSCYMSHLQQSRFPQLENSEIQL